MDSDFLSLGLVLGIFLAGVAAFLMLFVIFARRMRTYRISDSGIDILILRKLVRKRVRFDNIADIEVLATAEVWLPDSRSLRAFKGANRLTGPFVLIHLKKYLFERYVLISPDNPEEFVKTVRNHQINLRPSA